ncbi:MAG: collagen-like protein [Polyangiaceae bacterium]|nr:collagen-like protein [Polyangiaceae bacterium]
MTKTALRRLLGSGLAIAASAYGSQALAQVPQSITQQGRLYDGNGQPITGPLDVAFSLYTSAGAATPIWSETHTITFDDGYFSVTLGTIDPMDTTVFDGSVRHLGIKVGTDPEMTPRAAVHSVPYAILAGDVTGDIHPNSVIVNGTTVIDDTGAWVGGSSGLVGPTGPTGPAGSNGATGPAGADGAIGPTGPAGAKGATGATGTQGAAGAVGPTGPQGVVGAVGPTGPPGTAGAVGAVGPTGPAGAKGATGATGAVGPTGPQGTAGAVGPVGPTGPAGANGAIGPTGPSGFLGGGNASSGSITVTATCTANWIGGGVTVAVGANRYVQVHSHAMASPTSGSAALAFFNSACYRPAGGGAVIGESYRTAQWFQGTQGTNQTPLSVNWLFGPLPAGNYEFGLCSSKICIGTPPNYLIDYIETTAVQF